MSNVDNTDLNSVSEAVFEQTRKHYVAAVARWLGDVVFEELATDPGLARTAQTLLRELAERVEQDCIALPEALK